MTVTEDWSDFGARETHEAQRLLGSLNEIDYCGKPTIYFNTMSGCVFVCDEDFRVWMMNDNYREKTGHGYIDEWYSCPECGHEGFIEDMGHEGGRNCFDYLKAIGYTVECETCLTEIMPGTECDECKYSGWLKFCEEE